MIIIITIIIIIVIIIIIIIITSKDSKTKREQRGFLDIQKAYKGMGESAPVELCICCPGKVTAAPGLQQAALAKLGNF